MVNAALSIGATIGVLLSAGFVWLEVGRYAVPQVDASRFDERKEMIAYTAGLFVGIPLVVALLFLFQAIAAPLALGGIAVYLTLLVAGSELAQWFALRSVYFGRDGSGPFYALGLRAGIGGLLVLGFVTSYFSGPSWKLPGVPGLLAISAGLVALEAVCAVLALPGRADRPGRSSGPFSAVPLEAVGLFVLGFAAAAGPIYSLAGGLIITAIAAWLYRSVAPANLERIGPPGGGRPAEPAARRPFGRTDAADRTGPDRG